MIVEPDLRVPDFIKAGADIVSIHCEQSSTIHLHRTINQVLMELWMHSFHFRRDIYIKLISFERFFVLCLLKSEKQPNL